MRSSRPRGAHSSMSMSSTSRLISSPPQPASAFAKAAPSTAQPSGDRAKRRSRFPPSRPNTRGIAPRSPPACSVQAPAHPTRTGAQAKEKRGNSPQSGNFPKKLAVQSPQSCHFGDVHGQTVPLFRHKRSKKPAAIAPACRLHGRTRRTFAQVAHAASHRGHAPRRQLFRGHVEVAPQRVKVGIHQQRAVMIPGLAPAVVGVAENFRPPARISFRPEASAGAPKSRAASRITRVWRVRS